MAETYSVVYAVVAVCALAAGVFFVIVTQHRMTELRHHEAFAKAFFVSVRPLMSDDETPDEILEMFAFLNEKIDDSNGAREFFELASEGRFAVFNAKVNPAYIKAREFFARRPELEDSFKQALSNGFISMTFKSPHYGRKVRLLFTSMDGPSTRERAAITYQNAKKHDHNGDDCLAAA